MKTNANVGCLPMLVVAMAAGLLVSLESLGGVTSGMAFRRMMLSQYGREIDVGSEKVKAYHVIDVDVPAGGREAEQVSCFIGELLAQSSNVTATCSRNLDCAKVGPCDFGRACGLLRKAFFAKSEQMAFAGFAFLEGRMDLSDERYVAYSVHENSWCGSRTGGDYVTAFGVYGRQQGRRLGLADFFDADKIPQLDKLIRDAYAERGPRGNLGSYEEFRNRFPLDPDGMTMDPSANDNFTITPHGFKWAYLDRDIVGILSAAKEFPIEIEVPWVKVEPLLKDPALMPKVRF